MHSTLDTVKLPEGWTSKPFYARDSAVLTLQKPQPDNGSVTVDFKLRAFELGMVQPRPTRGAPTYQGRGWEERLVQDAVEALEAGFRHN